MNSFCCCLIAVAICIQKVHSFLKLRLYPKQKNPCYIVDGFWHFYETKIIGKPRWTTCVQLLSLIAEILTLNFYHINYYFVGIWGVKMKCARGHCWLVKKVCCSNGFIAEQWYLSAYLWYFTLCWKLVWYYLLKVSQHLSTLSLYHGSDSRTHKCLWMCF